MKITRQIQNSEAVFNIKEISGKYMSYVEVKDHKGTFNGNSMWGLGSVHSLNLLVMTIHSYTTIKELKQHFDC